jgi:hypothetical protein
MGCSEENITRIVTLDVAQRLHMNMGASGYVTTM